VSVAARPQPVGLTIADRVLAAVPLATVYVWLSIGYCIEAWKRATPWLFTDELELTQLSRSIAATGHAARRGEPHSFRSLYTILIAPVWLIHDVAAAYAGIKYLDVLVMTSVVFPTYFLARLVVSRPWALFAAAGAGVIPALAYSSWIVEEPLAYPYAALCFFLIAKALVSKRRWWITGAVVASLVAPSIRGELVVMPIALLFGTLFALWTSEWARSRRASWTWGDYIGFAALFFGAIFLVSAIASHHSQQWYSVTTYYKHRVLNLGDWAVGSLAIGLGVVPLVLGLASLAPVYRERRSRELRMFRCTVLAALIVFWLYTAMKAAYLSTVFETRVEERNIIYVAPLLFVGTAIVFERRRVNLVALALAAAYGLQLVVGTPFFMDRQLYSDALGLAILEQGNRFYEWTPAGAQWLLISILLAGVSLTVAAIVLRRYRALAVSITAALAVGLLAWNVTAQIAAAAGTISVAREEIPTLGRPFTWVDDVAGGKPTLYLAQGVKDQNPEWLLEFWNRSIVTVDSLDGTLGGPGPSGSPNISANGIVYWSIDPRRPGRIYDYAVEDWPCVDFAGTLAGVHAYRSGSARPGIWHLIRLTKPNRLRAMCSGIYPDGWTGPNDSQYFRFRREPHRGWLRITISRQDWPSTPVRVQIGKIGTLFREPVLGEVQSERRFVLRSGETKVLWLRVPASRFAANVVVDNKFVPHDVDPSSGDVRTLGALVSYGYFAQKPKH
jgi:hypothetical protein